MGAKKIKRSSRRARQEDELYSSLFAASVGLHGTPLGFGHFLRNLPDSVIQAAARNNELVYMITVHAKLIVLGDPNTGVPQEEMSNEALARIKHSVIIEHLRRSLMLRARYPQDPFTGIPECAWWNAHPFVRVIDKLPESDAYKLKTHILNTGDTTILQGHLLLLTKEEMVTFDERMTEIDENEEQLLAELEEMYGDARMLAWSGGDMKG